MSWPMMVADPLATWGIIVEEEWRKGPWTSQEDILLIEYVKLHGEGRWNSVASLAGLKRNGKSCRLRWVNYLRPDLKRGQITPHEERVIVELHARWGNRWSTIARSLPGRTDNEIKNYWRIHFKKKTKNSYAIDHNSKKSQARLLRRQQFQQQQQQQHMQQLHQAHQLVDMKRFMSRVPILPQMMKPDSAAAGAILSNTSDDDQQQEFQYSMINNYTTLPEATNEDSFWDGLWNLDGFNGNNISYSLADSNRGVSLQSPPIATAFY